MFGYISINKAEMKFKDYDVYHSYYCGLCKVLKECYGRRGQVTLSFDMTFLVILLIISVKMTGQTNTGRKLLLPQNFCIQR